jgi:sugar lactone lactonase YvrE
MTVSPELVADLRAELGEGPLWDDWRERLLFVDIMRGHVHEFDPVTKSDRVLEVAEPVGAVALTMKGDWLIATKTGFWRLDPESGRKSIIAAVEDDQLNNRMNDGYVDRRGRFWAGTMGMGVRERGSLYRLDPDGTVTKMLTHVSTSNGIDWSPDDRLMYYVDTPTRQIDCFDFDDASGTIRNRRPFVTFPTGTGRPDGLVVDADGHVWVALWNGGAVQQYAPDGRLETDIRFPVTLTTKCAFAGPDRRDVYVTSAWIDLTAEERVSQPMAGGIFRLRPGPAGQPSRRFAG